MALENGTPQWIASMFPASGGEDHLGLASVSSDQILPTLSPTINVATPHPRYHSFYAFLLDEFWRRDLPRGPRGWTAFFRPRDFIYSVAMHVCDHADHDLTGGVTGSRKTRPIVERDPDTYDTQVDYIKERLGGYGLYYRSVIAGLGLVYPGGRGKPMPVDVPTERSKEVAEAFRSAIADTEYYRDWFDLDVAQVPLEVIREYARAACLCRLRSDQARDGPLLRDAFMHFPPGSGEARRRTLRMLLELTDQTDGHRVDQSAFRRLIFFGATGDGATFAPRADLSQTAAKWRLYQAREYYVFALTGMWGHLCDWGLAQQGAFRPIPLSAVIEHVHDAADFDALAGRLGLVAPGLAAGSRFDDVLEWLTAAVGANRDSFDEACDMSSPINEHVVNQLGRSQADGPARIAGGLTTLALLYLRFGDPERWFDPAWTEVSRRGEDGRLSVNTFMRNLRRRLRDSAPTLGDIARWIIEDYVIAQHLRVAGSKLPENTFRFVREGNALRFYPHWNALEFSDSRFDAMSRTVHELGFSGDLYASAHQLSGRGRTLLEEGDVAD